ncbi:MAG: hypothetical protein AB7Q29_10005 [Vicinamibacterales bacterium]
MFRFRVWSTLGAVALLTLAAAGPLDAQAQRGPAATGIPDMASGDPVARGKYIVENIGLCGRCHSPLTSSGERDRSHWLMGGPVDALPAMKNPDWMLKAPRLAGSLPGGEESVVRALTTGISRTGRPLRPPMLQFRMTQSDAEAVAAYLKSLGGSAIAATH